MDIETLLDRHRTNISLVIGNGVNRYGAAETTNSWHDLLIQLSKLHRHTELIKVPTGVALTEFYDVLDLKLNYSESEKSLQQEFCDLISYWKPYAHHHYIMAWAKNNNVPVLTTNFDRVLADAGCSILRNQKGGFTAYYPWESYYGIGPIDDPSENFGIWHINGMERYRQSIRLGLSHYMGSVERARNWFHKGNEKRLFSGKNIANWKGANSWLHVIFNTPLLIFGLGLEENEVFLRWLLIERARYFKKFPHRKKSAWYVHNKPINNPGKQFFLDGVGIKTIQTNSYDELYGSGIWI